MAAEFTIALADGASAALKLLAALLQPMLLARTTAETQMLRDYIVADKLSGTPIQSRSGALKRSIEAQVKAGGNQVIGVVGSDAVYARILEFGGRIFPRSAAHLTIPLGAALGSFGEARFSARELISNPALAGFSGVFVRKSILFGRSKGAVPQALFKLQASVEIPARSYFGAALAEKRDEILDAFRSGLADEI